MARIKLLFLLSELFFVLVEPSLFDWVPNAQSFLSLGGATIVATDDHLFIDGGYIFAGSSTHPIPVYYNHTLRVSLRERWNNRTVKPSRIPRPGAIRTAQTLFVSAQNNEIYAFAGTETDFSLNVFTNHRVLDVLRSPEDAEAYWVTAGSQLPPQIHVGTDGLSADSPKVFYNLGGVTNISKGRLFYQYSGLVEFDKVAGVWTNSSSEGFNSGYGCLGSGTYLADYGSQGVLVFLGGVSGQQQTFIDGDINNGRRLEDMSRIHIYDIANKKFLLQTAASATGALPVGRRGPCMISVQDSDGGGYDLFMFGGEITKPTQNNDIKRDLASIWVLSLPSFQWTRIESSAGGQRRDYPSCSVIGARQMVIVGGQVDYSLSTLHQVADKWVDGLGIFDMGALRWSSGYDPNAPAYTRPQLLANNARKQPYPARWDSQKVKSIFTKQQGSSVRSDEADAGGTGAGGTDIGAIAGGVIGGVLGLAVVVIAAATWFFWRQRRRRDPLPVVRAEAHGESAYKEMPGNHQHQEKQELESQSLYLELPGSRIVSAELSGSQPPLSELP